MTKRLLFFSLLWLAMGETGKVCAQGTGVTVVPTGGCAFGTPQTLTDAATINLLVVSGCNVTDNFLTLSQSTTITGVTGTLVPNTEITLTIQQNGTGGFTLAFPGNFLNVPAIQTGANQTTVVTFQYCGALGNGAACPASSWQNTDVGPTLGTGLTNSILQATNNTGAAAFTVPGLGGSDVSTTPYTVQCDSGTTTIDRATIKRFTSGSAQVITMPDAGTAGCNNNFVVELIASGAGGLTVNVTTTSVFNIYDGSSTTLGATSFTMSQGQTARLSSADNTNWTVEIHSKGGVSNIPPTTATNVIAPTADVVGLSIHQTTAGSPTSEIFHICAAGLESACTGSNDFVSLSADHATFGTGSNTNVKSGGSLNSVGGNNFNQGGSGTNVLAIAGKELCGYGAPTISSGFGTSPSIAANNGSCSFTINVGTGGTAQTGVVGFPVAASTGWVIFCQDKTTFSTTVFLTRQTADSTTTATIGLFNTSATAAAWAASDILECMASGH